MCMAGHITLDAAQDLRGSQDYALEAPWDLSDFIQWPEKLQLNIKSSISMKKCGPLEIDKSLERPPKSFVASVQSLSPVQLFVTPWTAACQASLSITKSRSLLKLMSIESVMPSNISSSVVPFSSCLQSCPASGSFLKSQFFSSGGPKYWSFSFNISPPNEYSRVLSFKMTGWISLLSKGLSRVSSNTTVLKHQFFCTQLS